LSQKLKIKPDPDHTKLELQQKTIEKQKAELKKQKGQILHLENEVNLLNETLKHTETGQRKEKTILQHFEDQISHLKTEIGNSSGHSSTDLTSSDDVIIPQSNFKIKENQSKLSHTDQFRKDPDDECKTFEIKNEEKSFTTNSSKNHFQDNVVQTVTRKSGRLDSVEDFQSNNEYVEHLSETKIEEKHKPTLLDSVTNSKDSVSINKSKRRLECKICSKPICSDYNMKQHIDRVHKKVKPFRCQLCSKAFGYQTVLNLHIDVVHKKLRPYQCETCLKSFGQIVHLNSHVDAVHKNLKPFQCKDCSKAFGYRSGLKTHVNTFHKK
jgi:hypothetical protein